SAARRSRPGMVLLDCLSQAPLRDVRINLSCGNVGVTQHDLDAAQVRAAFYQMRSETVPDHMRRQRAADAGLHSITAQQLPERLPRHCSPAGGDEQIPARPTL